MGCDETVRDRTGKKNGAMAGSEKSQFTFMSASLKHHPATPASINSP
jgi:hypothetical protein